MSGLLSAKMLILLAVGLIVLGPERLPEVARTAGRLLTEFRRVSSNLQEEMTSAFGGSDGTSPLGEFRSATDNLRAAATTWTSVTAPAPVAGSDGTYPPSATATVTVPAASHGVVPDDELGFPPGDPSLN